MKYLILFLAILVFGCSDKKQHPNVKVSIEHHCNTVADRARLDSRMSLCTGPLHSYGSEVANTRLRDCQYTLTKTVCPGYSITVYSYCEGGILGSCRDTAQIIKPMDTVDPMEAQ